VLAEAKGFWVVVAVGGYDGKGYYVAPSFLELEALLDTLLSIFRHSQEISTKIDLSLI
jgi:hypothetical protein